jgi:hypothetical protein
MHRGLLIGGLLVSVAFVSSCTKSREPLPIYSTPTPTPTPVNYDFLARLSPSEQKAKDDQEKANRILLKELLARDAAAGSPSYGPSECTDNCSGHEAGYDWAEENEVTYTDDCGGNSDSFVEGCEEYAEEQQQAQEEQEQEQQEEEEREAEERRAEQEIEEGY